MESASSQSEKDEIDDKLSKIKAKLDKIEQENHKKDLSEAEMQALVDQQTIFEEKLLDSFVKESVTSIDITSKEIQVGLNQDIVNSRNIDSVVNELEALIPDGAKWHIVYSDTAEPLACSQLICTPIIGGNYIRVVGNEFSCSFGFQAKKGSTWGWITAGHCAEGLVGNDVRDYRSNSIGTVRAENNYWGTYCDCAWIESGPNVVDNKVDFMHNPVLPARSCLNLVAFFDYA